MRLRIGIDLMGGDDPPELLFPAILQAAKQLPSDYSLLVIGTKDLIGQLSTFLSPSLIHDTSASVSFETCEDVIFMTDDPLIAIRRKKKSSMILGMHFLKNNRIDAFISCGNTGALVASAAVTLPLLPGISHPALLAILPTKTKPLAILDVGGSTVNHAENLVRYAFLGAAYQNIIHGIAIPKVGLLNIGIEAGKGTKEAKQTYGILKDYSQGKDFQKGSPLLCFSGNIEGRDVFKGGVDVVITDGFTGNILLKTAEGMGAFIFESLEESIKIDSSSDFIKAFNDLKRQFDYTEYPGAFICGIEGIVVKMHGNATANALLMSILASVECIETQMITQMKKQWMANPFLSQS